MEEAFGCVVGDKEERGGGGGEEHDGPEAAVDVPEAAAGEEPAAGLQPGFQRVEGEEGRVDGGAGDGAAE